MRQLFVLFANRAANGSIRSIDSGAQSLRGSQEHLLQTETRSWTGSLESLYSLPAIKLSESVPRDTELEEKIMRRIRSRSLEKPVRSNLHMLLAYRFS